MSPTHKKRDTHSDKKEKHNLKHFKFIYITIPPRNISKTWLQLVLMLFFYLIVSNECKQCKDSISLEYSKWNAFSHLIMLFQTVMRCCRHWVSSCGISAQDIALFSLIFILFWLWQIGCMFVDNKEFIIQQPKNEEISLNSYCVILLLTIY